MTLNNSRKTPKHIWKILFWEISKTWKSKTLKVLERRGPTNSEDPSTEFLKTLNMGSISPRKHEMEILGNLEYGIKIYQKT